MRSLRPDIPDLQTQLEALFDQVWQSEQEADLDRRIAAAIRFEEEAHHREQMKKRSNHGTPPGSP